MSCITHPDGDRERPLVLLASLLLALGTLVATAGTASGAPPGAADAGGLAVYRGDVTPAQLAVVMESGVDRHEVVTGPGGTEGTVSVEVVLNGRQAGALAAQGVALTATGAGPAARSLDAAAASVFRPWSGPGNLREELLAFARANPGLVKTVVIGRSVQGQDILAFKVTKDANRVGDGRRPAVLYISAQHAREWITPEMTRRLLRHVVDSYGRDQEIRRVLDTTELWFVPVANPDGYDYSHSTERLWRKNLRDNNGNGTTEVGDGVDLNRNFPNHWGYDNEGSSPSPDNDTYRGTAPASEPKTRAMDGLMRRIGFEFFVNYHSAAELLLYGAGWQVATPTPDDLIYEALAGDDATPAVPGYDPDLSAELYTTNGDTNDHAHEAYRTLSFTPEMATCQTASAADPNDEFDPADCESVFHFPPSEALVQAEFTKNIPFALSLARSAQDPDDPVSVVGRTVPDFDVDTFTVSYGDPQTVAVTARRDLRNLRLHYRIAGGREQRADVREWRGGERFGGENDVYFAEFRGEVRGVRPGQSVEVWFSGNRPGRGAVASERFTYRLAQDGGDVLVLANEDQNGYNPEAAPRGGGPRYAQQYVDALRSNRVSSAVWDVGTQDVPHDLGVLSHFRTVFWYLGDNRLTQDAEDVQTEYGSALLPDASVAERQQYLTMSVRDHLNAGGKLALTGETAAYYGLLGTGLGGIYYGLNGAPEAQCQVTVDPTADCLILADDFTQYYMGAWARAPRVAERFEGTDRLAGPAITLGGTATNPVDEAGTFQPTSDVLPAQDFPLFASRIAGFFRGGTPSGLEAFDGEWTAGTGHADNSYMRLTRTVDLTGITAAQAPTLRFALSYDVEEGYDNVLLEAHTVGGDDWTTLPELGGLSSQAPPAECEAGFLLDLHPWLLRYLTPGNPCTPSGTTGAWNAITGTGAGWQEVGYDLSPYAGRQVEVSVAYVTDQFVGAPGVLVDAARIVVGGTATETESFETGLGPWAVPGAPAGSPGNSVDWARAQSRAGAAITTRDTVLLGVGIEQVPDAAQRAALVGRILRSLAGGGGGGDRDD